MTIYCATTNPGKLREFRSAGESFGRFSVETLPGLDTVEAPPETGRTFEDNAVLKARYYGALAPGWLFVDDSGLEVDALGGAPGVQSARFAGESATDADNNALLLRRLEGIEARDAQFVCVIALAYQGQLAGTFRGAVSGRLLHEPRGVNGFGYDPLFYYQPFGCTFAEAPAEAKMRVSHRAQALRQMFTWLSGNVSNTEIR